MKKTIFLLLLAMTWGVHAQEDEQAIVYDITRPNPKTTAEILTMTRMVEGSEAWNTDTNTIWRYESSTWVDTGSGGGTTTDASDLTTGVLADGRVQQSNVTQHQGALNITESQISDLGDYITSTLSSNLDADQNQIFNILQTTFTNGLVNMQQYFRSSTAFEISFDGTVGNSLNWNYGSGEWRLGNNRILTTSDGSTYMENTGDSVTGLYVFGDGSGTDGHLSIKGVSTDNYGLVMDRNTTHSVIYDTGSLNSVSKGRLSINSSNGSGEYQGDFNVQGVFTVNGSPYDDTNLVSALAPTNYTPVASTIRGQLQGIDNALGAVSGGGTDDQTASEVPFTPDGSISSTDTQAAIVELRDEALLLTGNQNASGLKTLLSGLNIGSGIAGGSYLGMSPNNTINQSSTIGGSYGQIYLDDSNRWNFLQAGEYSTTFNFTSSAHRVITFPDKPGTVALESDLSTIGEENATSSRTAVLTDADGIVNVNSASDVTLTVPANATTAFPIGTVLTYFQEGAGDILIAYAGGVTGEDARTFNTGHKITLWKTGTDTWQVVSRPSSALVTSAEYTALSTALKNNGTLYGTSD